MKFNYYFSGTDNGSDAILEAVAVQPENVLGVLFFSSTPSIDAHINPPSGQSIKAFSDEVHLELGKYQGAVLITSSLTDIFDLTATLFQYRYPSQWLPTMAELIPDVPCTWLCGPTPNGGSSVSAFHTLAEDDLRDFVLGQHTNAPGSYENPKIREYVEALITEGYSYRRAKQGVIDPYQILLKYNQRDADSL